MSRLSNRGFTSTRGLSYTFEGDSNGLSAALINIITHNLGALPNSMELWVETSLGSGNWEQHDPSTYIVASFQFLSAPAGSAANYISTALGGNTGVRLVAAAGAVALSVAEASASQPGIVSTGTQTFAGAKTFSSTITGDISGNAGTVTNGVYTSRTITAGDGLTGGGDLSTNRTLAVDSTVVRTTGTQTIAGAKTFTGALTVDSSSDVTISGGRLFVKENDLGNDAVVLTRDADEGFVDVYFNGSIVNKFRGNGDNYITGGNFGIGTASPKAKLHIQDESSDIQMRLGSIWVTLDPFIRFQGKNVAETNIHYADIQLDADTPAFILKAPKAGTSPDTNGVSIASSGAVTLGPSVGGVDHIVNGDLNVGKTTSTIGTAGCFMNEIGNFGATRDSDVCGFINRLGNDGDLIRFYQAGTQEGSISVSGTTVSYNGAHLSRWSQFNDKSTPEILRGTVLSSTGQMASWAEEANEQLTCSKVSDLIGDTAVSGVFDMYDQDDAEQNPQDFYVAQSGDFVIRIAAGVTVQVGDLLESAGDGTAKPQTDNLVKSSTIAKVMSATPSVTYEDGSYCIPCLLMIC